MEDREMTFEETYPRYEFSGLVRLVLAAAKGVIRFRNWHKTAQEPRSPANLGPATPAH
jgi:hypothetical protein